MIPFRRADVSAGVGHYYYDRLSFLGFFLEGELRLDALLQACSSRPQGNAAYGMRT